MVPEEKLAYGFKKSPIYAQKGKSIPNIPEEKLYSFDKQVIEYKDVPCRQHHSEEEESEEEEELVESKPSCELGHLNYNQMGYYPQKYVEPQFAVEQFETEIAETPCDQERTDADEEIGSCGYRPGRILDHANNEEEEEEDIFS